MSNSNPFSDRLREPLKETTRRVRRNLLAVSVIGVAIAKVGLVPSKISAFGINFTEANQAALVSLLIFVIAYFFITFIVYVLSELVAWQMIFRSEEMNRLQGEAERRVAPGDSDWERDLVKKVRLTYSQAKPSFFARLVVEIAIPVLFALYSAFALYNIDVSTDEAHANNAIQPTLVPRAADC